MSELVTNRLSRWLNYGLALLFFTMPWGTVLLYRVPILHGAVWQSGVLGWYANELILWCTLVVFMGWYIESWRATIRSIPFYWSPDRLFLLSCCVLAGWIYLTTTWAPDWSLAMSTTTRVLGAMLLGLVILVGPIRVFHLVYAFVSGAVFSACLGLWQFWTQHTVSSVWLGLSSHDVFVSGTAVVESGGERWLRAYGSFAHPNIFGGYLVLA
jgi:hypothetical protein